MMMSQQKFGKTASEKIYFKHYMSYIQSTSLLNVTNLHLLSKHVINFTNYLKPCPSCYDVQYNLTFKKLFMAKLEYLRTKVSILQNISNHVILDGSLV